MKNPYETMRDQIIEMQRYFANLSEETKKDPDIKKTILELLHARTALETLWVRTSHTR